MGMKPRHFIQLKTSDDIQEAYGPIYVPCDAPPAYWQRTPGGDLTPVPQAHTEALHRHLGPPRPAQRPPLKPVSSRLRDALNPKPRRYVPNYEDQPF